VPVGLPITRQFPPFRNFQPNDIDEGTPLSSVVRGKYLCGGVKSPAPMGNLLRKVASAPLNLAPWTRLICFPKIMRNIAKPVLDVLKFQSVMRQGRIELFPARRSHFLPIDTTVMLSLRM
jgi:hypothetical protein